MPVPDYSLDNTAPVAIALGATTPSNTEPTAKTVSFTPDNTEPVAKTVSFTPDNTEPTAKTVSFTPDNTEPVAKTVSFTPDNTEPVEKTVSYTPDNTEPVAKTVSFTPDNTEPIAKSVSFTPDNTDPGAKTVDYSSSNTPPVATDLTAYTPDNTPAAAVPIGGVVNPLASMPASFVPAFNSSEDITALITVGATLNTVLQGVIDGGLTSIQLVAGTDDDAPTAGIWRPADFDEETNAVVWKLIAGTPV